MPAAADRDRWLALGLLLGALALAYLVFVHPWWTRPMRAAGARIEALQQRELRARMQLQQAPEVARLLAAAQQRDAAAPAFLAEPTTELATAGLVQRLEAVVAQASPGNRGCAISNRSPLEAPAQGERFARVTVQVRLRCGNAELAAVLHALESGTPRVFVDNLSVLGQRYFYLPGQDGNQGAGLDVGFDLYGYLRPAPEREPTEAPRAR
ncbi:type II secretion system protein GspM [Cognatiluteimonas weifangensis]|uniref:General secretion pathway protein GspM n=1 Tax=Cognatiluteimonas weifangensis TaxID=2303539 RepID=A0A372DLT1_9GAMM|nr:type II secretion system protein GspM [Luteimonas weifangensis]RFP60518.1 general secretion pathway protein GspM [Luteimonas weifangensis]